MTTLGAGAIVQDMNTANDNNTNRNGGGDDYRSFLLLDEISKDAGVTQRSMSKDLGIALGLINSYVKNLISKGYVTVSGIPKKRYTYYLTPKGFREKTRLTYAHLKNFTNLYRVARKDFSRLFANITERTNIQKVAFSGIDEITEIAYLSLKETTLELAAVFDNDSAGKNFFGLTVRPIADVAAIKPDLIVITSFAGSSELKEKLLKAGVDETIICDISTEGCIKKITKDKGDDIE